MNLLVVLVFNLLLLNIVVFFVKSSETGKTAMFVRLHNLFLVPFSPSGFTRKTPANVRKIPQTPAHQKNMFFGSGVAKTPRNHSTRPTRPKLPGNQNAEDASAEVASTKRKVEAPWHIGPSALCGFRVA